MKKQMAYPQGMLVRKDGNIRYQYRIPKDLLQYYARGVVSENLGTTDKAVAARIINAQRADLDNEFARHRCQQAIPETARKTSITDHEAARVATAMLASAAKADEEIRHGGLVGTFSESEAYGPSNPLTRDVVRLAAAKGDYETLTGVVNDWLIGHGYDLDTGSDDFRKVAREFAKATGQLLQIKSKRDEGEFVDSPSEPVAPTATAPSSDVVTLARVVRHFLENYDQTTAMFKKHQAALALLLESLGDVPVTQIRQLDIDTYFDMLCRLPPRWSDDVRRLGISATELAQQEHTVTLSPKTFQYSYMASVRPFLAEAKRLFGDRGFPERLTVEGIRYKGTQKEGARKQRAFRIDELKRLFEGREYSALAADPAKASEYWLPLLGLYTGARINEICQLNPVVDIREEHGIWFFDFTEESAADAHVTKSIKTAGSRRKIPIHSQLLELGFRAYVERIKAQGATRLFPVWVPTRGRASPAAEEWFSGFLRETGLRDETHGQTLLGMHAFRHTLLHYGFNNHIVNIEVITGHAGEASRVVRGYRGEMSLPNKSAIIEQVRYDVYPPRRAVP